MSDPKTLAEFIERALTPAFTALAEAGQAAVESIGRIIAKTRVVLGPAMLRQRRIEHGGMAREARLYPDEWMSAVCSGLICSITECPSDKHDLRCNCPCHRKDRR